LSNGLLADLPFNNEPKGADRGVAAAAGVFCLSNGLLTDFPFNNELKGVTWDDRGVEAAAGVPKDRTDRFPKEFE
jgi:hypothetical protein